jgi:multisubunit Na+/H+ antiporter MnhG subunit
VLLAFGAVLPRALKWVYIAWMSVAFVLGFVMAHVILTLLFFLMITPIGLIARVFGKDFLSLKLDRKAATYWIKRERKPSSAAEYERQF